MSFLSPWVLAGLAAVGAPILIHLLNKFRVRTTDWGAMKLLADTVQQQQRRVKLDDLILLILRCLVVALAVLAFARLVLKGPATGESTGPVAAVVVLDNSASMAQSSGAMSRFDLSKTAIRTWLDHQDPQSLVGLYLAATRTTPLVGKPENDFALFRRSLDEAAVSDYGSDFTQSLHLAVESLAALTGRPKEIRIYTDGQATALLHREELRLLAREHPDIVIRPIVIGETTTANLGLVALRQEGVPSVGQPVRCHAEILNSGTTAVTGVKVEFTLDDRFPAGTATIAAIAPGETQSADVMVTYSSAGPHRVTASLPVDGFATDNQRTAAVEVMSRLDVVIADSESSAPSGVQAGYFLSRALVPVPPDQAARYYLAPQFARLAELPALLAQTGADHPQIVFLCDPAGLPSNVADALDRYVKAGGNLVVFPGSSSELGTRETPESLARLLPGSLGAPVEIAADEPPKAWQADGFTHPITTFWNDPANGSLGAVKFTRFCPLTLPASGQPSVIAAFSDGQPAVVEWTQGRGTVVLFNANLTRQWTNFPLHPAFVPFLQRLLGFFHRKHEARLNFPPGEAFRKSVDDSLLGKDFTIQSPGAPTARTAGQVAADESGTYLRYAATDRLGAYQLNLGPEPLAIFAVQLDPAESDLRPLDPTALNELSDVPRSTQCCQLKPPETDFAKNGGGQYARATGGPGILPETRMGCFKCKVDSIARTAAGADARTVVLKEYWPALIWAVVALLVAEAAMAHRMSYVR